MKKCEICEVILKNDSKEVRCSSCKNVEKNYKKKCVACGFTLPIIMKTHYIKYGNYCMHCSGQANFSKGGKIDFNKLLNEQI